MSFHQRREKLRAILSGNRCIRPGSVYDAISIRIATDLGFEVGMFGGSVASLAVLGDPDIALITLTELWPACGPLVSVPSPAQTSVWFLAVITPLGPLSPLAWTPTNTFGNG